MINFLKDIANAFIIICSCIGGAFILFTIPPKEETVSDENISPAKSSHENTPAKKTINRKTRFLIILILLVLIALFVLFNQFTTYDLIGSYRTTDEATAFPAYAVRLDETKAINAFYPNQYGYATNKIVLSNKNEQDALIQSIDVVVDNYVNTDLPFFRFNIQSGNEKIEYHTFFGTVYEKEDGDSPLVYIGKLGKDGTPVNREPVKIGEEDEPIIPRISFPSSGLYTIHYIIDYSVAGQNKRLIMPNQTFYIPNAEEIPSICQWGIDPNQWKNETNYSYNELKKAAQNNTKLDNDLYSKLTDEDYINNVFIHLLTKREQSTPSPEDKTPTIDLSVVAEKLSYHLSWTKTDEAKEYIVKRSVNKESFTELFRTSDLDYVDEDVSYGNEYWYVIDTVLSNGDIVTSNMGIMYSPDKIPKFPEPEWARIRRILTPGEKVHLFVMPIDDRDKYMLTNGLTTTDTHLDKHFVKAFFQENEFVLVESPMRQKDTEIEKNKQLVYIKIKACDIYPSLSSVSKSANIKGIIITDNPTLYYGPGDGYVEDTGHKVSKGTEITILYKQDKQDDDDYYYVQYTDSNHDVRTWLKQTDVKVYINQN